MNWTDPVRPLEAALEVLRAPLEEVLPTLSRTLSEAVPHRAVAMFTGDCVHSPLRTHGEAAIVDNIDKAELRQLASSVDVGRPWFGETTIAGARYPVLAAASAPPASAGALLAIVLPVPPGTNDETGGEHEDAARLVQRLWDITVVHIVDVAPRSEPARLGESRAAASRRALAVAELTGAHATTLTSLLAILRSRRLDDTSARRTATNEAVSALVDLRATSDRDRSTVEETVGLAFDRLTSKLSLLARYSEVSLEFVAPESPERVLPAEVATAARSTVRGAILAMLEQGDVTRIRVEWRADDAELRITVRDDGPGSLSDDAFAAYRLADRLGTLDGKLNTDAVPGWGTTVTGRIPLTPPDVPHLDRLSRLNPRELDVLRLLTHGRRNRHIAERLHISEHTVKFHVANILGKLSAASRGEAAAIAREAGLNTTFGN